MSDTPIELEQLLQQSDWLGALAHGLVGDRTAADDLAQEAMVAALATGGPRRGGSVRGWLRSVLRNRARDAASSEQRRRWHERRAARAEAQPSAADAVERFALHRSVCEAVMALDEPFRSAVVLRYWDDLPPRAIARQLDVPVETVRSRLRRGLERLRVQLDREHGSRRAWAVPLLAISPRHAGAAATSSTLAAGVALLSLHKISICALAAIALVALGWSALVAPEDPVRQTAAGEPAAPAAGPAAPEPTEPEPDIAGPPARVRVDAGGAADAPETWAVMGRLVDEASGAPVAGAEVRILDGSDGERSAPDAETSTESAADGSFRLVHPLAHTGELLVLPREHATVSILLALLEEPKGRQRDVGTVRVARGVSFAGRVIDRDGRPVAGAALLYAHRLATSALNVLPSARELARTDVAGRFALTERLARPAGGVAQTTLVAVARTGMGWIELDVTRQAREVHDLVIQLWPSATLEIEAVDADGRAIPGARVRATKRCSPVAGTDIGHHPLVSALFEKATDRHGRARFDYLPISSDLVGRGAQFGVEIEARSHPEQRPLVVELDAEAATYRRVQLERAATATIEGRVTDVHGAPVAGASVAVAGRADQSVRTDESGRYRLAGVDIAPTDRSLEVSASGYRDASRELGDGGPLLHVDVTLSRALVLEGRLVDQHGAPVAGMHLFVEREWRATTADDGAFRIDDFPEGEHEVVVARPPEVQARFGARQSPKLFRADRGPVTIEIERLAGDASLVAELVDAATGERLEPVELALLKIDEEGRPCDFGRPVPRSGNATADHLTVGRWRLGVRAAGAHRTAHDFVVEPGQTEVHLHIELPAPGRVEGRIDLSAVPPELVPAIVRVRVHPGAEMPRWVAGRFAGPGRWRVGAGSEISGATADNTGTLLLKPSVERRFWLDVALPGELRFTAEASGLAAQQLVEVAPGGSVSVTLRLTAKKAK